MRSRLVLTGFLTVLSAAATAGDLRWEDVYDGGQADAAFDVARGGGEVIAVGRSGSGYHVRATTASSGALLWEDHVEIAGGSVRGAEVVLVGDAAYAVGVGNDAMGAPVYLVRAYRRVSGTLLWEDSQTLGMTALGTHIAADAERVYVATSRIGPSGGRDMLVRAHDAKTGDLAWEDSFDRGGDDMAADVEVHGGVVYVCGASGAAPFPVHTDFAMRALDARTGALVWEDFHDFDDHLDQARELAVAGGRVYATGFGRHPGADDDILVRAYDAASGAALWTDSFDRSGGSDFSTAIVASGTRAFIGGWAADAAGDLEFLVRAYDGESGGLLWMDLADLGGDFDWARDVDVQGARVYAVGQAGSTGGLDGVVRSYDAANGALAGEDRFGAAGIDDLAGAVSARGGVTVAGVRNGGAASPTADWRVRAYRPHGHCSGVTSRGESAGPEVRRRRIGRRAAGLRSARAA